VMPYWDVTADEEGRWDVSIEWIADQARRDSTDSERRSSLLAGVSAT
jgi:hypothetical protein